MGKIAAFPVNLVEITGGEPLLQPEIHQLIDRLHGAGKKVLLETNGSRDISGIDRRVQVILDVKTPGSGMDVWNYEENFRRLGANHQLKFVLCSEDDFWWSRDFIRERLPEAGEILFSPVVEYLNPSRLAELILQEHLPVRLHLQLHRLIWPEVDRGR